MKWSDQLTTWNLNPVNLCQTKDYLKEQDLDISVSFISNGPPHVDWLYVWSVCLFLTHYFNYFAPESHLWSRSPPPNALSLDFLPCTCLSALIARPEQDAARSATYFQTCLDVYQNRIHALFKYSSLFKMNWKANWMDLRSVELEI